MKAEHSVRVNCSMYDYGTGGLPHPRDIPDPPGVIASTKIPQSLYDSWWLLYEFESNAALIAFIEYPPAVFKKAGRNIASQEFFDKWAEA